MQTIPLTNLPKNHAALIVRIFAGRGAARRLTSLGLTPGTRITKLSAAPFQGPVQLLVRNTRLVIGWGLASKIIVSEITHQGQSWRNAISDIQQYIETRIIII